MKVNIAKWPKRVLAAILAVLLAITFLPFSNFNLVTAKAAVGATPQLEKILQDNNDGTYKLALSVTGDSEKKIPRVNVIVIVDRSGSMDTQSGTGAYVPTNGTGNGLYGLIEGQYVPLERRGTAGNRTFWYNGVQYTGQRYQYDATATRMQATQAATNSLAETLLDYNGRDGNPNDTVQLALVSFATNAQTNVNPTTSYSSFSTAVNGLDADGGTNWEAALRQANGISFGDRDQTFVIFFSDGSPTFHSTDGGYNNWNNTYRVYGSGQEQEPNMERSYTQAVDDATTLATKVGANNFYTIFAYGTNTGAAYMRNLTTAAGAPAGNNYSAGSTAELNDAFAEILESIEMAGLASVDVQDPTSAQVQVTGQPNAELLEIDEHSFKYYRAGGVEDGAEKYDTNANSITQAGDPPTTVYIGEEWTDIPENAKAKLNTDGTVEWDLSEVGVLENGVTYTVTFDVYPSQYTFDLIADLKNGKADYETEVPQAVKDYIKPDGSGGYTLKTNKDFPSVSWDDTRDDEGIQTEEATNPEPVPTAVSEMDITKVWYNDLDSREKDQVVTMDVKRGDTVVDTITVSAATDPAWYDMSYISTGLMRVHKNAAGSITGIEVLDEGHDYSLVEPSEMAYYWELVVEKIHPMLINGVLTTLVQVIDADIPAEMAGKDFYTLEGVNFYRIAGKVYKENGEGSKAAVTAYNERRSNLNVTKIVDGDAPEGADFEYTITVNNSNAASGTADDLNSDYWLWFSVYDTIHERTVSGDDLTISGTGLEGPNDTGYYHIPSGNAFTVNLQEGWNLRFTNLPKGTTYNVVESSEMAPGFAFESVDGTTTYTVAELPDGAVDMGGGTYMFDGVEYTGNADSGYTATYRPTVEGMTVDGKIVSPNASYQVKYTNKYPKTKLVVNKTWAGEAQDDVKVQLYQNGTAVEDAIATLSDANGWTYTFSDLELVDQNNVPYVYTAKEEPAVEGYETTYGGTADVTVAVNGATAGEEVTVTVGDKTATATADEDGSATVIVTGVEYFDENGAVKEISTSATSGTTVIQAIENRTLNITNTQITEATVVKVWDDAENQDGIRPQSLNVTLSNGTTVTLNEENEWTETVENLPKYDAEGKLISYTWTEGDLPDGYELTDTSVNGTVTTLTNSHTPEETEATVKKVWDDAENQDGKRPESLTVTLSNGTPVTLSEENGWTATVEHLPKYANGKEIAYTWTEGDLPEGYELTSTSVEGTITTLTNSYEPEETEATVKKVWDDKDDQDGIRPDSLKVTLSNGTEVTLNEENAWTATVENLPVYADGVKIAYTWTEGDLPEGYELTDTSVNGTVTTLTNSHTPAETEATVKKDWDDADNQDGKRPESLTVTLSNGTEVSLSDSNAWTATVENLPKYADGSEIVYTWTEDEEGLPEGYELTGTSKEGTITTLTNSHKPEETEATVKKVWDDKDDQDGIRPESLKVTLSNGQTVTLQADNSWTATIRKLPKYASGKEITYTWTEDEEGLPEGYELTDISKEGTITTLTNSHTPETLTISGEKVWADDEMEEWEELGYERPEIKIILKADGEEIKSVVLNGDPDWKYEFKDLPKYKIGEDDKGGHEIEYTVTETNKDGKEIAVEGYTVEVAEDNSTVTNTPVVKEKDNPLKLTIKKVDSQTKEALTGAEFTLTDAEGTETVYEVGANGEAEITFTKAGEYTLEETKVPEGYENPQTYNIVVEREKVSVSLETDEEELTFWQKLYKLIFGDGTDFDEATVTLTVPNDPIKTKITAEKTWYDNEDAAGNRLSSITVKVTGKAAGETVYENSQSLTASTDWKYTWENLATYYSGNEVTYTVTEDAVSGYDSAVGELEEQEDGTYVVDITNILLIDIPVEKTWVDFNNRYNLRPESISLTLKQGEETVATATVTPDDQGDWKYTFTQVPAYTADGTKIKYSVEEAAVDVYTRSVSGSADAGFQITNTLRTGDLKITKDLTRYNDFVNGNDDAKADQATFIFEVTATWGESTTPIYHDFVALTFDGATSDTIELKSVLPVGAKVTVKEVYSGASYEADGSDEVVIPEIKAGTTDVATANFKNAYTDKIPGGYGIENHYTKDGEGKWTGEQRLPAPIVEPEN